MKKLINRACPVCEEIFECRENDKRITCSPVCRYKRLQKEPILIHRICANPKCSVDFTVKINSNPKIYHNSSCATSHNNLNRSPVQQSHKEKSSIAAKNYNKNHNLEIKEKGIRLQQKNIANYNLAPIVCCECKKIIPYEERKRNICIDCRKINQNYQKKIKTITSTKNYIRNAYIIIGEYTKIVLNKCNVTGKLFYHTTYRKYSSDAALLVRKAYASACSFQFNVYEFPRIFDLKLVGEIKWYHPVKNPTGISRDHMYSISDGWKNKIDPNIINHPANCCLMPHVLNQNKGTKSSITLLELLKLIKEYDLQSSA